MQQIMQAATSTLITPTGTMAMKHSMPFHISPASLFRNKRLKQKRLKREAAIKNSCLNSHGSSQKPDSQPTFTINLLSDDEEQDQQQQQNMFNGTLPTIKQAQMLIMPEQQQQQYNYQRLISNSEPPPLVPLANSTYSLQQNIYFQKQQQRIENYHNLGIMSMQTLSMAGLSELPTLSKKRKRKTNKKNSKPIVIMNNTSIVLSDDSDQDSPQQLVNNTQDNNSTSNNINNNKANNIIPILPELTLTAIHHRSNHHHHLQPKLHQQQQQHSQRQLSSGGEEEVTVSLVPRTNNSSSLCSTTSLIAAQQISSNAQNLQQQQVHKNIEIFPMLPDETIVHTVIANRTYELSLTKLREGLAQGEQTAPVKNVHSPNPNMKTASLTSMPPTPISLKLSSDLSISLISDDEDDIMMNQAEQNEKALLTAEKLRREQPQLSVQQVSGAPCPRSKQPPTKRRKLG